MMEEMMLLGAKQRRKTVDTRAELLMMFKERGYTLRECAHPMRLGPISRLPTLAKLSRKYGIFFSDLGEVEAEIEAARGK